MTTRHSDIRWIYQQTLELFSWTGISWLVALFLGVWGAMLGIGAFVPAYISLGICIALCVVKWAHVTCIHTKDRRLEAFVIGTVLLGGVGTYVYIWTHERKVQADEDARKLEPLKQIPTLQKQLEELPRLKQTIVDLQASNKKSNDVTAKKEELIEGLARTVVIQQGAIAHNAHKDLQDTQLALSTNINQYRTDTSSAVSRIMRPPRTLGANRASFVAALKISGPHEIAITPAHGSEEAIGYAAEIQSACQEAGWTIVPTKHYVIMIKDGIGIAIVTKQVPGPQIQFSDMTIGQAAISKAFAAMGQTHTPMQPKMVTKNQSNFTSVCSEVLYASADDRFERERITWTRIPVVDWLWCYDPTIEHESPTTEPTIHN